MIRSAQKYLERWLGESPRKPLVLRGARQVGKSTLVRDFATSHNLRLLEINLERSYDLSSVFHTLDTEKVIRALEGRLRAEIRQPGTLLFLDEIQAVPEALPMLRYFYEDVPDLPVVAAGSLLEFTLKDHNFSMPVGRVEYLHLGPMDFREYLMACDPFLLRYLDNLKLAEPLPEPAHEALLARMRQYFFVGGMPEAVKAYVEGKSLERAVAAQRSILANYEDDFNKYANGSQLALMREVFMRLPMAIARKVKYVNFSREAQAREIKVALKRLELARICAPVYSASAAGVPLRATVDESVWKPIFLDVGLLNRACGFDWERIDAASETELVNEGALAEQFVGQHLIYSRGPEEKPESFYWLREGRADNAEVDFLVADGPQIIPVEVKAGKSGSLRSLHQLMADRHLPVAFRFDLNQPSRQEVETTLADGRQVKYTLYSLPLYAVCELPRLAR